MDVDTDIDETEQEAEAIEEVTPAPVQEAAPVPAAPAPAPAPAPAAPEPVKETAPVHETHSVPVSGNVNKYEFAEFTAEPEKKEEPEVPAAPEWDGHTCEDVDRLLSLRPICCCKHCICHEDHDDHYGRRDHKASDGRYQYARQDHFRCQDDQLKCRRSGCQDRKST